ncbi:GNAT family N-acetyltransferase [Serratia symbiotica]|uniref:N-acetyltransferase n=1 Tax=Serratia symbiotica TaxID=138074 RepID=A0A068Z3K0_9GAMM|nr:N-acetyltransferase [Serratia symbiotica]MBF1994692.1 N-acetyltransferase [Serratia symbiotica]MBQ0955460.1 N-acetyltransferase [Serratia symbiotica]QLH61769.1 N-acetyltransferase [Serratia symbiotica]QTP14720.1 N-acetyltransferase [Serratia symbiotica]CDS56762.1 putative acyltransferase with acyl-CoA N-acyltransferase domain [Serratia symbiotica]
MLIRVEIPVDAVGIDVLLHRVFGRDDEADLVQQLREAGLLTLGIVATDNKGGIVGYAAFSPVNVAGEDRQWVGLAPLVVDESLRRQGLGEKLIYEGLDALNEFSYAAVVVLGDPAYYGRFGFKLAAAHGLHCRWSGAETAFQVYPLVEDALSGVNGVVEYSEPFNRL